MTYTETALDLASSPPDYDLNGYRTTTAPGSPAPSKSTATGARFVASALDAAPKGLQASHVFWIVINGGSGDWSNVITLINGNPVPSLHRACPKSYGSCDTH